ncbi:MAG TPA: hypothetical protein DEV93_12010 [Chloroflexi bacterium]|jgi:hypothetical protein|nr:hypothetical protein [Chloroflexota bacterium]
MIGRVRALLALAASLVAVLTAVLVGARPETLDVVILGSALLAGYLIDLRPATRSALPLGYAVIMVLLRAASPGEFVAAVAAASAAAVILRADQRGFAARLLLLAELLSAGLGAGAVYRLVADATSGADASASVLGALASAAVVEIAVNDLVAFAKERRFPPLRARGADLALVSSGMLMAVGYGGIGGQGRLGLWGPLLFAIPLFAAWYSFELLRRTRRTFRQTVQALGVAPELGGLVRAGHVERVAKLAVVLGNDLELPESDIEDLETAAWLHHLGAVCLDEPVSGSQPDATEVARAGAEMLRSSHALTNAGDVVAAEPSLHRAPGETLQQPAALMGQILKVASAYDELTEGEDSHAQWAVDALFTGPAYVYDGRVLAALERVLKHRGLLTL